MTCSVDSGGVTVARYGFDGFDRQVWHREWDSDAVRQASHIKSYDPFDRTVTEAVQVRSDPARTSRFVHLGLTGRVAVEEERDAAGDGLANKKGVGIRWTDPANQGNGIRIDQGIPGSSWPSQQVDHVVVRSGGQVLGPDGKPIVGSLAENPQAHIPLSDWLNWAEWSSPG